MSEVAEFKEKTFEKYFGYEIARKTKITFSPDQCDEAFLGFDDAFFLSSIGTIPWLPYMRRRRLARLSGMSIGDIDSLAEDAYRRLPPFKFNLFVQYKRPEYIDHHRGKEWAFWGAPYFRFDITVHQQKLLAEIERKASGRASVVYAAAAFWKSIDLYSHAIAETVVQNSNVANAARLNGHERFSYKKSGSFGRGHSEPVEIKSSPIQQIIEAGLQQEELAFSDHIKRLAIQIDHAVELYGEMATRLREVRRLILGDDGGAVVRGSAESFSYAVATIIAFSDIADVSLYAIG